ncbi:NTP transferase domain-containing protein [Rheinheimera soli]|jgi:choline kinase|uniref:Choline kinase n=1 Tax=Rheinheimera soli TaxID=443616 RepID=A0ABU1VU32_9GAMM|nr:NTP transferase domain-containing protein [Rheinheimera soli]MDR7119209.1 choline kinase [Rheinheimera soli]
MQTIKYAVISAAGMGTRLGLNKPKCLVEINGKPIIDHLLDLLKEIEQVRIVVGFMETELIDHVKRIRKDVVFVRNPEYKTTSNSHSLWLASKDINEAFLAIDGDMIIEPKSFKTFLSQCDGKKNIIGVAVAKTEEAVFVELDQQQQVTSFFRAPASGIEWCGIACFVDIAFTPYSERYIYQFIEDYLPLDSCLITCCEIDTPADLELATKQSKSFEL